MVTESGVVVELNLVGNHIYRLPVVGTPELMHVKWTGKPDPVTLLPYTTASAQQKPFTKEMWGELLTPHLQQVKDNICFEFASKGKCTRTKCRYKHKGGGGDDALL